MALGQFSETLQASLRSDGFRGSDDRDHPPVGPRRPVWVTGLASDSAAVRDRVLAAAAATGLRALVVERRATDELQTFSVARSLLGMLLGDTAEDVRADYREALEFVAPDLVGISDPRPSPLDAHAVAFAIVRRISRESLQTANHVDALARLILDLHRRSGTPWALVLERFDHVDRPSMRVLHRLQWLAEPADALVVIGLCAGDPLVDPPAAGDDVRSRVAQARSRLYRRVADDLPPAVLRRCPAGLDLPPALGSRPAGFDYTLRVAENLVEQNYDQAYLLAERGLSGDAPPGALADLHRLVGLVDANIGAYDAAQRSLRAAVAHAEHPPLRAHLHYLLALLLTKRHYDLDEAEREYRAGLAVLDAVERDDEVDFERAWLCNGLAFVQALRSRSLDPQKRTATLEQVLRDEIAAFAFVKRGSAPHLVYLRYNLLANMAFVLEMLERYREAIGFWERAFGQYVGQGSQARRFEPIYRYRVGLLQWKCGQSQEALTNLVTARDVARTLADRFLEERILYGLGSVALSAGDFDLAREAFADGLALAYDLRDWPACAEHGRGAWTTATRAGDADGVAAVSGWLAATGHPLLVEASAGLGTTPMTPPSPKLPAYLPGIDLEPTPDVNLNLYLVSGTASFPAPPSPDRGLASVQAGAGSASTPC